MQSKVKRGMLYFVRSCLFSALCRCGRFLVKSLLPFCLCFTILLSLFILPSYAAGGNLLDSNLTTSSWSWVSDQYTFTPTLYYNSSTTASRITIPASPSGAYAIRYTEIPRSSVYPNHNYQLSFDVYGDFSKCRMSIGVDVNGNSTGSGANLVTVYANYNTGDNVYTHGVVNFVPENISDNVDRLVIRITFSPVTTGSQVQLYVKNLSLVDTSDNDGLLSGILDWISRIYHSIAGGTDSQGVYHQGIVAGINSALNVVKNAIVNAIDGIEQWFIDLKDNIINGLKSLFVPSPTYFSTVASNMNDWFTEHFGALYQGPQLAVEFLTKLFSFVPANSYSLSVPAIEFRWNGEVVTLLNSSRYSFDWVNDNTHPLYLLYQFYRAFVTLILFFLFFNYLRNKYFQIFNNGVGSEDN